MVNSFLLLNYIGDVRDINIMENIEFSLFFSFLILESFFLDRAKNSSVKNSIHYYSVKNEGVQYSNIFFMHESKVLKYFNFFLYLNIEFYFELKLLSRLALWKLKWKTNFRFQVIFAVRQILL